MENDKSFSNLCSLLQTRALLRANELFIRFIHGNEAHTRTFGQAHANALQLAQGIKTMVRSGDRVLLGFGNPCEFVETFFAILHAGAIPVPVAAPRRKASLHVLEAIALASGARLGLLDNTQVEDIENRADAENLRTQVRLLSHDAISCTQAVELELASPSPDDIAFLQFTSGSTSAPKGVIITHRNLLANQQLIKEQFGHSRATVFAGWLPLYHDMGFIGNVLQPLYLGVATHLLSPMAFVERPIRLLKLISEAKATTCGMPNFGYAQCLNRINNAEMEGVDLSSWQVAFNGAEPIRGATLQAFSERFAPWGFRPESLYPCYGLAEATLLVTGSRPGVQWIERLQPTRAPENDQAAASVVSCGHLNSTQDLRIVDPATGKQCSSGEVGEILVRGPCIGQGYWNCDDQTTAVFSHSLADGESGFLKTGDLGFIDEGQLYVVGRLKDLIIVRGKNHYPQDIEASVEACCEAFLPSGTACFMVDEFNDDRVVVVQEIRRTAIRNADENAWRMQVRDAIAKAHSLTVADIQFVLPNAIPRTSSGKIQRRKCRELYKSKTLESICSSRRVPGEAFQVSIA